MTQQTNETFLRRAKKLLALAHDGAATEAEAALAAEKLQALLQDRGLTMAQVGATSTEPDDRKVEKTDRGAFGPQHSIMEVLAENNFCLHRTVRVKSTDPRAEHTGWRTKKHMLVGRAINVDATLMMYDYLVEAMERCAADAGFAKRSQDRNFYLTGMVSRIVDRLVEKRRQRERESQAAARPRCNGTGRELVLTDVYGSESDLNNDALNNFPAGTTAANRRKAEERMNARAAERDRLVAEGVDPDVAWYRAHGYGEDEAKAAIKRNNRRRGGRGRTQNWTRGDEAYYRKINSSAYKAGRVAGAEVGLDDQVGATRRKAIT